MNKQQTAVEWLESEINRRGPTENNPPTWLQKLYNLAQQMEKQQIKDAYNQGYRDADCDCYKSVGADVAKFEDAEKYYKETYGTE